MKTKFCVDPSEASQEKRPETLPIFYILFECVIYQPLSILSIYKIFFHPLCKSKQIKFIFTFYNRESDNLC